MEYTLIDSENKEDFALVLPEAVFAGQNTLAIGAWHESSGVVCGAVSLTQTMEEYRMDWLYVIPAMRRRGIASGLLREVNALIEETGLMPVVFEFAVEITDGEDVSTEDPENSGGRELLAFFESLGDDHLAVDVTPSHTRYLADARDFYASENFQSFDATGKIATHRVFEQGDIYKRKALGLIESHFSVLDQEAFENSCISSLCLSTEKNGVPTAVMLAQKREDYINLSYLYGKNPKELFALLSAAAGELRTNYPDAKIVFDVIKESAKSLSERFFKNADRFMVYEAEW